MASKKPAAKPAAKKKAAPAAKKSTGKARGARGAPPDPFAPSVDGGTASINGLSGTLDTVRSTLPIADDAGNPGAEAPPEPAVILQQPEPPPPPAPLPQYQSHKKVRAAVIVSVRADWAEQGVTLEGEEAMRRMGEEWMARHRPQVGWYLVEYEDGYVSCSPAETFEAGYTAL